MAGIHYPIPLHRQPAYVALGYGDVSLPHTERAAAEVLSLPMFPELTDDADRYVADTVRAFRGMTVRLALVGLGYWGPNLARNLAILEGGELAHLCDADKPAAWSGWRASTRSQARDGLRRRARRRHDRRGRPRHAGRHATSTLAKAALEAGKHVLVEKPLATTSAECEELIDLADERDLPLMVGHVFLYNAGRPPDEGATSTRASSATSTTSTRSGSTSARSATTSTRCGTSRRTTCRS